MNIAATIIVSIFMLIQIYNMFEIAKHETPTMMLTVALTIVAANCCIYYAIWN
jgi:hypothetical protein